MRRERIFQYGLFTILAVLLFFSAKILLPFATYIILALMLAYVLHPVYSWLKRKTKRPTLASTLMLIGILLVIIIPSTLIVSKLVVESRNAYTTISQLNISETKVQELDSLFGIDTQESISKVAKKVSAYFEENAPSIVGSLTDALLGFFVLFFVIFYGFLKGEEIVEKVKKWIPLGEKEKAHLVERVGTITNAVIYGQVLTAIIQGSIGGLMFLIFGIPNPVFWGVIMIILSFIPMMGTPIIWLPVALYQLYQGAYVSGIGILIVGGVIVMNVDNVIRPYLIGSKARISTPVVLLGVLGGLKVFGFTGLLLGPLILALTIVVISLIKEGVPIAEKS